MAIDIRRRGFLFGVSVVAAVAVERTFYLPPKPQVIVAHIIDPSRPSFVSGPTIRLRRADGQEMDFGQSKPPLPGMISGWSVGLDAEDAASVRRWLSGQSASVAAMYDQVSGRPVAVADPAHAPSLHFSGITPRTS